MIQLNMLNILPLISFVLYGILLIIVQTSNRTRLSDTFSLYVVAMMIWSLGSFLMKTDVPPSSLFWNKVMQIGFVSVPVLLLRFSYHLTDDTHRRAVVNVGYVLIGVMIVLAYTNNVISSVSYENGVLDYTAAWGAYVVAVFGTFYSVLALVIMIQKAIRREVSIHKIGLVIIGLFLVVIGGALNISPMIGKYGFDILLNAVNALLITYAIYRNKFLEINLVVKRGLTFSLSNLVLFILYAAAIISEYNLLVTTFRITDTTTIVLLLAPLFLALEVLRFWVVRIVRHVFYHSTTDRQRVLKEFSELVTGSLELQQITSSMATAIAQALDAKEVHILLKNTNKYYLQSSTRIQPDSNVQFQTGHPIVHWFQKGKTLLLKTHIDNHVMFKGLWDSEKNLLRWLNTEIIAPIRYTGSLIGFVILAERRDATPYSVEETEFLGTIINNAAAIIENAKTMEMMQKQSITDELTKFHNHRHFQEIANNWIRERRYTRFGLAIIDIDQFKIYNDLYGHASGDVALRRIAEIIRDSTTDRDLLVRFGGEEFVVLYPDLEPEQVWRNADAIRNNVEQEFLLSDDIREFLTVTIGIANYDINGHTLEELITKADRAVLQGKQSGRNKTILYREDADYPVADKEVRENIRDAFVASIYALAATIDAKDHYTYGHSNNVAVLSEALARHAGFDERQIETVRTAGLLHDIGKVGIPEHVLSKPGFLTDQEYEIMKGHVVQSINIIKHIPNLIDTIPIVISHHERYDGKGYPRGIAGENIPILGRILCIADSFDAMTTDRPYRKGLSLEQALYELKKNAGKQFDPDLVDLFIELATQDALTQLNLENRPSFNG
jgi:diguanylate cyclase (GGDEF)-like protein/putative nucleotidyltransferase with HDIG domain